AGITRAADEALVAGAGPALQGAATAVTPRPAGRPLRRAGGRLAATTVLLLVLLMLAFGRGHTQRGQRAGQGESEQQAHRTPAGGHPRLRTEERLNPISVHGQGP